MYLVELANAVEAAEALAELPPPQERRRLREVAGLSLQTAGAVCDVAAGSVARWERGERTPRLAPGRRYRQLLAVLSAANGGPVGR